MRIALIAFIFLFAACASTGPQVTSEEERRVQAILQAEAQAWQKQQEQIILGIAARLMKAAENVTPLEFQLSAKPVFSGKIGRISPDVPNAWTDGKGVWITRGMLRFLKNDDELAIVLAHEMVHAYRGHVTYGIAKRIFGVSAGIVATLFVPGTGKAVTSFVDVATKKFDRDQEREADFYGLIWASKAGFNVKAAMGLWRRMAREMPETITKGFLSSHPNTAERLLRVEKVIATIEKGTDPLIAQPFNDVNNERAVLEMGTKEFKENDETLKMGTPLPPNLFQVQ
jgi:predicted Zn-dependent protease